MRNNVSVIPKRLERRTAKVAHSHTAYVNISTC